ncbi:unnamed protein product [Effrenium voratum]|uniref:Small ribosomal subunit protein mS35 mitochondrial conserved domain-containing protein n=2 Tax=Effrenium voratum TaxID=2562239 RepID=A0AA36IWV9_9DINO|nr:unnamed protein product [Effrenium voratum]CAJ1394350.1 unnamed protein product [Effrenium voratum]CAJ1436537.1 unnamed protein product [Effrenium voratum]
MLRALRFAEPGRDIFGFAAPLQVRAFAKKGKRKKKPKRADRTEEQKAASAGQSERIFDNIMEPETPHRMSLTIRQHMRGLMSDGRHNIRRKKDLTRYTNYRVMRIAGLTHDNPTEKVDRRGFVTPLTELQDRATLPRSANDIRFRYPHTLSYKVYWGPPSVQDEPNEYEGSMVGCRVAVRLCDLPLTQRQKERLVDIVGTKRVCEKTGVVTLEADHFPERNHNAALLGDMLEQLMREAMQAEPVPDE